MKRAKASPYSVAIRSISVLGVIGMLVLISGFATKNERLTKIGTAIFLSAFAVWGLANGGAFVWGVKEGIKKDGVGLLAKQPWSSGAAIFIALFFLSFGVGITWFIVFRIFG